jgi:prephenate dehydrogenase
MPGRIGFLGLGLIGGSIVRALREAEYGGTITAWTPTGNGPAEAARTGLVDEAAGSAAAAIDGAGLVVLAGPALTVVEALDVVAGERAAGRLDADATITDVASTKAAITARASELGLPFVGGHPMAGREVSGFAESDPSLFVDRPWVIMPVGIATHRHVVQTTAMAWAAGARPLELTAEAHDAAVAAISHLPLVASAALVESVTSARGWAVAQTLAASGWASATRLAKGDPDMGADILVTNAPQVAGRLRALRDALDTWLAALEADGGPDREALRARLEAARIALEPGGESAG